LRFWIKSSASTTDTSVTSTPKGEVPPVKIILLNVRAQAGLAAGVGLAVDTGTVPAVRQFKCLATFYLPVLVLGMCYNHINSRSAACAGCKYTFHIVLCHIAVENTAAAGCASQYHACGT
jgi:hypothetical protein